MLTPQEPRKDRLGAQQGLGRAAAKRGGLTQAFRELDSKASRFTGALGKLHQLAEEEEVECLSRRLRRTASFSMPRSNVSAHGRRTRGKEQGRQRQSEPAADKGSGTGTRQAGRQRPRHMWEGAEKDSCRKSQRPRDKERSREGEGEAGRVADTGTGTEREKHNGQKKEQREGTGEETERTGQQERGPPALGGPPWRRPWVSRLWCSSRGRGPGQLGVRGRRVRASPLHPTATGVTASPPVPGDSLPGKSHETNHTSMIPLLASMRVKWP